MHAVGGPQRGSNALARTGPSRSEVGSARRAAGAAVRTGRGGEARHHDVVTPQEDGHGTMLLAALATTEATVAIDRGVRGHGLLLNTLREKALSLATTREQWILHLVMDLPLCGTNLLRV